MNLQTRLETAADELAAAAEQRDFAGAAAAAARYTELLQQAIQEFPPPQAVQQIRAASQCFETARRKICVARAHIAERLRRLHRAAGYRTPIEMAVHTWSVEG